MSNNIVSAAISSLKAGHGLKISKAGLDILRKLKINWLLNYEEALEKAYEKSGDPAMGAQIVMACFLGSDWCSYCEALNKEVFNNLEFQLWFNGHLMEPLLLDYPQDTIQPEDIKLQNAKLLQQYNITDFPTVVAIKAESGYCTSNGKCVVKTSEVGRVVGYMPGSGVDTWIASFSAAAKIK